jgi:hypothetical protein
LFVLVDDLNKSNNQNNSRSSKLSSIFKGNCMFNFILL